MRRGFNSTIIMEATLSLTNVQRKHSVANNRLSERNRKKKKLKLNPLYKHTHTHRYLTYWQNKRTATDIVKIGSGTGNISKLNFESRERKKREVGLGKKTHYQRGNYVCARVMLQGGILYSILMVSGDRGGTNNSTSFSRRNAKRILSIKITVLHTRQQ